MTITAQTSKTGPYSGNGTTTVFSYTFEVQDETHLVVTLADASGVETVQVLNTNYTVSGVGNANGGQITMSTAPASGYTLTISRNVPITQEVDLENRRSVAPEVLEDAYDKLTQIAQDLSEQVGRAIKISVTEGGNPTLTLEGDVQPGTFLGFDASGNLAQLAPASGTFISPNAAIVAVDDFTGDGTTVDFTLGGIPQSPNNLFIFLDGVMQDAANYTVSGTTLTFTTAPPLNTNIEVRRLQAVALTGGTTADLVTYSPAGSGAVNTTVETKLKEFVSVKDFGAVGDYATDDTNAINAALSYAAPIGSSVFFPSGVYRYTGTLVLPVGVRIIGSGAPKIASFPQVGGDKSKLRPGYKDKISGSSIIFDGTGALSTYTTNRSDKFASVVPMVLYDFYDPMDIHGIAFIQDMDVLTAGGVLTTSANDNRATNYTAGVVNTATLSLETDLIVFGYFDDAGYILHNQDGDTIDPDYQTKTNCLITGGVAIIGHDTAAGAASEGLTGSRWTACGIYGADHHTRADGIYTVPCLYIDGKLGGGGSNTGIRGHSFGDCNFRTYANDSISLDNCNDVQFVNSVWEFSVLAGVPNADAGGGFVGTANTKDVTIVGGAGTSDPKLNTFLTQISGNYNVIGAGSFGGALFGQGGSAGVRVTGSSSTGDSYVQLTDDISSTATGWKIQRDGGTDNLDITYQNSQIFSFSENGGIANGFGFANLGTQTIASGAISVGNGSFYRVDTEGAAATDDLDTITTSAIDGHILVIAASNSARTVVCKDGTGNLRLAGDFSLDNGQDRLMLMYDGTNWVEISRSNNS